MTEKLINSKANGVLALILIELALVLGVFIFVMGAGSENIFWNYYRTCTNRNCSTSSCWFKSCQTSRSSGSNTLW